MNLADFIKTLADANIRLSLQNGSVSVSAPKGSVTSEILANIKQYKAEIVRFLQRSGSPHPFITPANRQQPLHLSYAQERLWLLDQMSGSAQYNMPCALKLVGNLQYDALNRTISDVLERHESLRTCFHTKDDGQPLQVIQTHQPFQVSLLDLSALVDEERQVRLRQLIDAEASQTFDLSHGLMLRAKLLKLAEQEHVLLITLHHIASDGWSVSLLLNEFSTLYGAYCQGKPNPLPPLSTQYVDYAQWQRNWLKGEILDHHLDYWSKQLADLPVVHSLPLDHARPPAQTFIGTTHRTRVGATTSQALNTFCQSRGATLFMGLHAAFSALLSRYSNETDIVVGSPIANREQNEIANLIGFFVNTLVLRSDLSGNPSFITLLEQSKLTLLEAYAHQQVPFEQLVERVRPERSLSHSPLFQIMLVLQNNEQGTLELPGLTFSPVEQSGGIAKYDLTLEVTEDAQGLQLDWEYNTGLFEAATIARLAQHFERLLESLLKTPETSVFDVDLLSDAERQQLLVEWNNTQADYPHERCIHELFEAQAERDPNAIAAVFEDQQLSYGQLNDRANQLAHYLINEKQVKPDTLVGLCIERSLDMVVGLLGILKAGGAYVPLDPDYPSARLAYMLEDAKLTTVITHSHLSSCTPVSEAQALCLDDEAIACVLAAQPDTNPEPSLLGLQSRHLAYVIYTSGSTGNPKGVMVEQNAVVSLVVNNNFVPLSPETVLLQNAPLAFDAATFEVWGALLNGGRIVIQNTLLDIHSLGNFIHRNGINVAWMTSGLFDQFATTFDSPLPALSYLLVGGDVVNRHSIDLIRKSNKRLTVINGYGPTENTTFSCCYRIPNILDHNLSIPIGKPLANRTVYIVNAELHLSPPGVVGELCVAGTGLGRGYLNRPELTAEKFIPNPFHDQHNRASSERLYKTGDLARWLSDGNIEFLGRIDHQVKIRGFRIELGEIEHALAAHDDVKDVVVLAKNFSARDKRLVAYIVAKDTTIACNDAESAARLNLTKDLRRYLSQSLPDYMTPAAFVFLDRFPLTVNGKINRKGLPEPNLADQQSPYIPPTTTTERLLCEIWQEILDVERVGITDDFFQIGGHSILVMRLVTALRNRGVHISPQSAYKSPTVSEMADRILVANTSITDDRSPVIGEAPLLINQRWFIQRLTPNHWNKSILLELVKECNPKLLQQSLKLILKHHDGLRTVLTESDGEISQNFVSPEAISDWWHSYDLIQCNDQEVGFRIEQICTEYQKGLDIYKSLFKVIYFDLGKGRNARLMFVIHGILTDAIAGPILLEDLFTTYASLAAHQTPKLPPKTTSLKDWANWQMQYAQTEALEHLPYWRSRPWGRACSLPNESNLGALLPDIGMSEAKLVYGFLSVGHTLELEQVAVRTGLSINHFLVTALLQAYAEWAGSATLVLLFLHNGRSIRAAPDIDLSRTVGWLPNYCNRIFDLTGMENAGLQAVYRIKKQYDELQDDGLSYSCLRYMNKDPAIREEMKQFPKYQLEFNYIPPMVGVLNNDVITEYTRPAPESAGPNEGPMHSQFVPFGKALHQDGRLGIYWGYCPSRFTEETLQRFVDCQLANLKDLIKRASSTGKDRKAPELVV